MGRKTGGGGMKVKKCLSRDKNGAQEHHGNT